MSQQTVLTGITTTGSPHLGNYVGAIKPAIRASRDPGVDSYFFLADFHALIKCTDPEQVRQSTLEIAATWLALGLDPANPAPFGQTVVAEDWEVTILEVMRGERRRFDEIIACCFSEADAAIYGEMCPDCGPEEGGS